MTVTSRQEDQAAADAAVLSYAHAEDAMRALKRAAQESGRADLAEEFERAEQVAHKANWSEIENRKPEGLPSQPPEDVA